jgi:hypothetical protein
MGYYIDKDGDVQRAKKVKLSKEQKNKYLKQTPEQKRRLQEAKKRAIAS